MRRQDEEICAQVGGKVRVANLVYILRRKTAARFISDHDGPGAIHFILLRQVYLISLNLPTEKFE